MEHPGFLLTPVLALTSALVGAALASRLGQPVVLGYILAGVAIGPFTPGPVGDLSSVRAIADVGIVLLMFAIGVEISLRDLVATGRKATIGAPLQIVGSILTAVAAAPVIGIPAREGFFVGAAVAISSTALLTKMLSEMGWGDTEQGRMALSWSAIQDFAVVVLAVVLWAVASPEHDEPRVALLAIGKALLFVALVAPVASRLFPWLLERIALLRNREVFVLTIGVVALGTAVVASWLGLSLALGAFVAGVVIGESDLSQHILGEVGPVRDVFAGLFFVSVGMLIDPLFVRDHWMMVVLTLALIMVPKVLLTAGFLAIAGSRRRAALLTAALVGNSGEFSFLLAQTAADLGAISAGTFSAVLAGTAASMILSPLLVQRAPTLVRRIETRSSQGVEPTAEGEPRAGGHAVICGYGRVGHVVGEALRQRDLAFLVIEEDLRVVRALRAEGIAAIAGNAGNARTLERAGVGDASVLVVAVPDPLTARQIVGHAQRLNGRLDIVVRTHSATESAYMRERGVAEAVMGENELALEMTRHTLHRYGLSNLEILAVLRGLRERLVEEVGWP